MRTGIGKPTQARATTEWTLIAIALNCRRRHRLQAA